MQLPGRLIAQRNKVQIFRVSSPRYGGNQKNPSRAEMRGLGRRPPSGRLCRKSRAANHVRGVWDPQSSLRADCRTPWRSSSGAASLRGRRGARKFTVPLPFTVYRGRETPRRLAR
jgi:hypothetical protein